MDMYMHEGFYYSIKKNKWSSPFFGSEATYFVLLLRNTWGHLFFFAFSRWQKNTYFFINVEDTYLFFYGVH